MTWEEIYEILKNYNEVSSIKRRYYSYTFVNRHVSLYRLSNTNIMYNISLDNNTAAVSHLQRVKSEFKRKNSYKYKDNVYHWVYVERIPINDIPYAEDYVIASQVFYPYTAMLHIKSDPEKKKGLILKNLTYYDLELDEKRRNYTALNNIKIFVDNQDQLQYDARHSWISEDDKMKLKCDDCAWAGIGNNEYAAAEFYFNYNEYHIYTNDYLAEENRNRRHFKEQEFLFPWRSNKLNVNNVLYITTASLIQYRREALKQEQENIIDNLKILLKESGIEDYELIQIKRMYKYFNK